MSGSTIMSVHGECVMRRLVLFVLFMFGVSCFADESKSTQPKPVEKRAYRWNDRMYPFMVTNRSGKWYVVNSFSDKVKNDDQVTSISDKSVSSDTDVEKLMVGLLVDENIDKVQFKLKRVKDSESRKKSYEYITVVVPLETALDNVLKQFETSRDDINDLTVYSYMSIPIDDSITLFPAVVVTDDGQVVPRVEVVYSAKEWIFMDTIIFKQNDVRYDIPMTVKTNVLPSAKVLETGIFFGDDAVKVLDMVEKPDKLMIRLTGKEIADYKLSESEVAIFQTTNILYKFLKQKNGK